MHIGLEALCLGARNTGIGVCVSNLLAGLGQLDCGEKFTLYTTDFAGEREIEGPEFAQVFRVPRSADNRLIRAAWRQWFLNARLKQDGIDVLHGTAYMLPAKPAAPAVVTVHDAIALTHPELCRSLNAWHFRSRLPRTVREASRIIVHSRDTADQLMARLGVDSGKIEVLRPGIADMFFENVSEAQRKSVAVRYRLPERYVLYAGNLEPKKDLGTLLDAFRRLKETEYPGKLVLTGPQSWKHRTIADRMSGLDERVHVTGYVQATDMPAMYAGADAGVLVSLVEGFGLPVVEAMAAGTPVIASDIPGLAEATGDAACKVKPKDPVALAETLRRVLTDRELCAGLRELGKKHAESFRSIDYARRHVEIYRGLR